MSAELQMIDQGTEMINAGDSPIQAIAKMAASGVGTEVIEQMKGLVEWDDARKAKAEFNSAFSKAKRKFKQAKKSGYNAHLKSYYSLLEDYDNATREALAEFGLSWRHVPKTLENDVISVTCVLAHESGHYEVAEMQAPGYSMTNNAVNKMQSVGIVNTYLKRMTLCSLLGLVSDSEFDNDGNGGKTTEYITEEQAANIQALIDEVGADKAGFLKWCKSESLETIPANKFKACVSALEERRKQ